MTAGFVHREVSIGPYAEITFDPREWQDAIVVIADGALEVNDSVGHRCRFESGAILCFDGLSVRALRNAGELPLVLIAVSRSHSSWA